MDRCALFVDAGYVLADGAMAVHGTRRRESVSWDYEGLLRLLASLVSERSGLPLLRCYWYDATAEGRRAADHDVLADLPGVKLRLAKVRPGRRAGVEGEIHRDLTTLARNKAVTDAMVVSAEEDLAEVIAEVQDLGMRVTMLHILVDGNWTISRSLREECDDTVEINAGHLRPYVELISGAEPSQPEDAADGSLVPLRAAGGQAQGGQPTAMRAARYVPPPPAGPANGNGNGYYLPPGGGYPEYPGSAAAEYQRPVPQHFRQRPDELAARNADAPAGDQVRHGAEQAPPQGPVGPILRAAQWQEQGQPQTPERQAMPETRDPRQDYPAASSLAGPPPVPAGAARPDLPPARQSRMAAYPEQQQVPRDFAGPQDAPGRPESSIPQDKSPRADMYMGPVTIPPAQDEWTGEMAAPHQQPDLSGYGPGISREPPRGHDPLAREDPPRETLSREAVPREAQSFQAPPREAQFQEAQPREAPLVRAMPSEQEPADEAMPAPVPVANSGNAQLHRLPSRAPAGGGPVPSAPSPAANGAPLPGTASGPSAAHPMPAAPAPAPPAPPVHQGGYGPGRAPSYGDPPYGEPAYGGDVPYGGDAPYGDPVYNEGPYGQAPYGGPQPADLGTQPPMTGLAPPAGADPAVPVPGAANGADPARRGGPTGPMPQTAPAPGGGVGPAIPAGPAGPVGMAGAAGMGGPAGMGGAAAGQPQPTASLADAVQSAHEEGQEFGDSVARDAPALWLEAVLARKPRMPSDLEARLLQGSALPIDFLLHDEVRHALRRGFWDALERARR